MDIIDSVITLPALNCAFLQIWQTGRCILHPESNKMFVVRREQSGPDTRPSAWIPTVRCIVCLGTITQPDVMMLTILVARTTRRLPHSSSRSLSPPQRNCFAGSHILLLSLHIFEIAAFQKSSELFNLCHVSNPALLKSTSILFAESLRSCLKPIFVNPFKCKTQCGIGVAVVCTCLRGDTYANGERALTLQKQVFADHLSVERCI